MVHVFVQQVLRTWLPYGRTACSRQGPASESLLRRDLIVDGIAGRMSWSWSWTGAAAQQKYSVHVTDMNVL